MVGVPERRRNGPTSRSGNEGRGRCRREGERGTVTHPDRPPVTRFAAAELPFFSFFFEAVDPRGVVDPTKPQRTHQTMGGGGGEVGVLCDKKDTHTHTR